MIYNYTKCESVIAKIMADLNADEVRNRTTDIREWIFEAVDKIGAPMLYISKESGADGVPLLKIQDGQVPMPSDLAVLDGVAYAAGEKGPWIPMLTNTALFKNTCKNQHKDTHHHTQDHLHKLMTSLSQLYTQSFTKYVTPDMEHIQPEYFIKPGWIVTNRKKGYIKLAYKAIAVDERGYPLIPDSTSYQEAVYWYVVMKLNFPKYLQALSANKNVKMLQNIYFYTLQQWNFYRNQAYAEAMMPTADDMRNIKNDWNKLVPDWDADNEFFRDINKEQTIYNDYYNGY